MKGSRQVSSVVLHVPYRRDRERVRARAEARGAAAKAKPSNRTTNVAFSAGCPALAAIAISWAAEWLEIIRQYATRDNRRNVRSLSTGENTDDAKRRDKCQMTVQHVRIVHMTIQRLYPQQKDRQVCKARGVRDVWWSVCAECRHSRENARSKTRAQGVVSANNGRVACVSAITARIIQVSAKRAIAGRANNRNRKGPDPRSSSSTRVRQEGRRQANDGVRCA